MVEIIDFEEEKLQWAYTKIGEQDGPNIDIETITQENRKQYRYFCPACNKEIFPVLGTKRRKHFRHKRGKGHGCTYKSYLHNMAQSILKEKFDRGNEFPILVWAENKCDQFDHCFIKDISPKRLKNHFQGDTMPHNRIVCEKNYWKALDLKTIYDTCELEKGYKGFVADVKLSNSKDETVQPMFLEVCYTHACSPEKISSGIPLIEIYVRDNNDLRELMNNRLIQEKEDRVIYHNVNHEDKKPFEDFQQNKYSLKRIELYISEEKLKRIENNIPCHDLWTGKHSDDSIADVIYFNDKQEDKEYAEHCVCALAKILKKHCAFCKYGTRYISHNGLKVKCAKNMTKKYTKTDRCGKVLKDRNGQPIVDYARIDQFTYDSHWDVDCQSYEFEEDKLKKEINERWAVGWWRTESTESE